MKIVNIKHMLRVFALGGLILGVFLSYALPSYAQGEVVSVGGGWWSMPNVDDQEGTIDTSGPYLSLISRSVNYLLEVDYGVSDTNFLAFVGTYLYPLSMDRQSVTSTFVGAGYTYFLSDELEDEKGLNVLIGAEFGANFTGIIRYDFLGSDQEMITFGLSYTFQ